MLRLTAARAEREHALFTGSFDRPAEQAGLAEPGRSFERDQLSVALPGRRQSSVKLLELRIWGPALV